MKARSLGIPPRHDPRKHLGLIVVESSYAELGVGRYIMALFAEARAAKRIA
jgi:hypothetical protein